jgi:hypothetical protein
MMCVVVMGVILLRQLFESAFFIKDDRVNTLFYSAKPIYFSLEKGGEVHYVTTFNAESRTAVPGGYGVYRMGALGKLIVLEKNPELLKRTFSRITGSMIDYYFYPQSEEIYYGSKEGIYMPTIGDIFFLKSNANIFDRVYIYIQFIGKHKADFEEIHIKKIQTGDSILLSDITFARQFLGFFYNKTLRKENKTVQLLYKDSYIAARSMSRIVDGEGIRVVDIDVNPTPLNRRATAGKQNNPCIVMENTQKGYSRTAEEIAQFFHCILIKGKGRVSDIVVELGKIESEWE